MHRVGVEPAGEGRVGAIVEAVEQIRRLACDHDDRPGGAEAHDFVGGQERAAVAVLAAAGGRGPGFEGLQLVAGFSRPANLSASRAEPRFSGGTPNRVKSSFLKGQNGWKPTWARPSHAIRAGAV